MKSIFSFKGTLIIVLISTGMCYFANFAMPLAELIVPQGIMEAYVELMDNAGFGKSLLPTLKALLLAPIVEEFIFRGVTFYYAKKMVAEVKNQRTAFWIANCAQAVLFGVFHLNIVQGTYAFISGLALGYLVQRFKSILPAIMGHVIINGLSVLTWEAIVNALPEGYTPYIIGTSVAMVVIVCGFILGGSAQKKGEILWK